MSKCYTGKEKNKKKAGGSPLCLLAERLGVPSPLKEKAEDVLGGTGIVFHYAILAVCRSGTCGPPDSPPHKYVIVPTLKIVKQKKQPPAEAEGLSTLDKELISRWSRCQRAVYR